MKFVKWFILVIFTLILVGLTAKGVIGYCNETITHTNQSLASSDYTITKTCTEEYNNNSFYIIILVFLFFTGLVGVALFKAEATWVKTVCVMGLSILLMSLTRFMSWFVSITNPAEVELINTLDHYFMFAVWGFRIVTIAAMFVLLIIIINSIRDNKSKKKDNWDSWGKE